MTDRGLPPMDGSPACPFVAFDDDRDARADQPDHRHRCFAEAEPAPRALAHQEAYCLSSAFPVCPTFQAWARREAAHARPPVREPGAGRPASGTAGAPAGGDAAVGSSGTAEEWASTMPPAPDVPIESTPRRNPPRDWAAPPPWATGGAAAGAVVGGTGGSSDVAPAFLAPRSEGQGLAGSAADRLASGQAASAPPIPPRSPQGRPSTSRPADLPHAGPDPELAGLVAGSAATGSVHAADPDEEARIAAGYPPSTRSGRRPSVSSTRTSAKDRSAELPPQRAHVQEHDGPSWERARRFEAYPQIRTRVGLGAMPAIPRIVLLGGALGIAALALFFLPALLGVGGDDSPSPTPSASLASPTVAPTPTPVPEPTPQTYTIQSGDTLSKIAREFGVTLDALLEANKETITNPDRIKVGDEIIIPVPVPDEVEGASATP